MERIVVVGCSNTDMIIKMQRIPKPGETIIGGDFSMAAGGKGANQAVAAARSGGNVTFIARVGNDLFGEQAIKGFAADGINVDGVIRDANVPSGVALIFVGSDGENSIAVASGANAGGRRLLNQGIKAPWSGHPKYNIHANDIDFQIESDFIGMMTPGLPQEANKYADRVGHVMNYGLKPGAHTVRIVLRDDADARSKGKKVVIQRAITYRAT